MKQFYILCITVCLSLSIQAQVGFNENIISMESYRLWVVESADFNSDGNLDIVFFDRDTFKLVLGLKLEMSNHYSYTNIPIENMEFIYSNAIKVVDMDNDGDIDIILQDDYSASLFWLENDGMASFNIGHLISDDNITQSGRIITADMDNDGDLDVIIDDCCNIEWYENINGFGDFNNNGSVIHSASSSVKYFQVGDFDNDGDLDVVSNHGLSIRWSKNIDGQGTFGETTIIDYEGSNSDLNIVDRELDGDLDIIVLGDLGSISWYENIDGTFMDQQFLYQTSLSYLSNLKQIDIDSDNDMDFVGTSAGDNTLIIVKNDGNGNLSEFTTKPISNTIILEFGDYDGDNDVDIFLKGDSNGMHGWYENIDGNGNLGEFNFDGIPYTSLRNGTLDFNDVNNDGIKDLLFSAGHGIYLFKGKQELGTYEPPILISELVPSHVNSVKYSDLDGDGDLDIIGAFGGIDKLLWFENLNGEGVFSNFILIDNLVEPEYINVADVDGDGDNDILVSNFDGSNGSAFNWYENIDGLASFSNAINILNVWAIETIMIDVDLDSDIDIVTVYSTGSTIKLVWLENSDGLGTFTTEHLISDSVNSGGIDSSDIDGDGDIDFIYSNNVGGTITWFENNDGFGGDFISHSIPNSSCKKVKLVDVDGDGDKDIIYSKPGSGNNESFLGWYENDNGLGNFSSNNIIGYNEYPSFANFLTSDIDLDGDVDFFVVRVATNTDQELNVFTSWYENLGYLGNSIQGQVKYDINLDGCSTGDLGVNYVLVTAQNGDHSFSTFTSLSGSYEMPVDEGMFTNQISSELPSYFTVSPSSYNFDFVDFGNVETNNFCIYGNQETSDLSIVIYPPSELRVGFNTVYTIVYRNSGTTSQNGQIILEYDTALFDLISTNGDISSQTTDSITFGYSNLLPFETRSIEVILSPSIENISVGDVLNITASILPSEFDFNEEDNIFNLIQEVVNSWDPNDIIVLEGEEIYYDDIDKYLHYLIRFQNNGNADAINIRVNNKLDQKLDWSTIQLETMSHEGRVEIVDGGTIDFIFENIHLPDSTSNEPESHGYIAYKIKPKQDVEVGDIIYNFADIYFDFNSPVRTNTVSTEIVESLSVAENELENIKLYPNPTDGLLYIKAISNIDVIEVYNLLGQKMIESNPNATNDEIDLSKLNNGTFLIKILTNNKIAVFKIIKN